MKCWIPRLGQDEGNADDVPLSSPREAARYLVEHMCAMDPGCTKRVIDDGYVVHVRDDVGALTKWSVYGEPEVVFHAKKLFNEGKR